MQKLKDHLLTGFIPGLIAPTLIVFAFYLAKYSASTFESFLYAAVTAKAMSPLLSLSVLINLGLFYLMLKYEKLASARGVILATLIYGVAIVVLKFAL